MQKIYLYKKKIWKKDLKNIMLNKNLYKKLRKLSSCDTFKVEIEGNFWIFFLNLRNIRNFTIIKI